MRPSGPTRTSRGGTGKNMTRPKRGTWKGLPIVPRAALSMPQEPVLADHQLIAVVSKCCTLQKTKTSHLAPVCRQVIGRWVNLAHEAWGKLGSGPADWIQFPTPALGPYLYYHWKSTSVTSCQSHNCMPCSPQASNILKRITSWMEAHK